MTRSADELDVLLDELEASAPSVNGSEEVLADESDRELRIEPDAFFDSNGLNVPRLVDAVSVGTRICVGHDGRLYRFGHGAYRPDGETFVKNRIRGLLDERFRRRHLDEAMTFLRAGWPEIGEHPPAGILNVRNGLLNLGTLELSPHDPAVMSTIQLPVDWDPEAVCPAIEQFLGEVLGDAVEMVLELIGYATYPGNPFRVAVLLLGPGRNGKTVVLRIIVSLLGRSNVSNIPLQQLAENRFSTAELFGKLANICGDLDARAIRRSDLFKMATGGDLISAERKYGNPFTFTPFALPLFSANEPPVSSDQTDAWFDRWLIVPMERRFSEDEADPFLVQRLTTDAELSGLLVLAVHALRRLMERGRFERPRGVVKAGEAYRDKLDTVRGFVSEACCLGPDEWVSRSDLYAAYRGWCTSSGRLAVSAERFNDHLRANFAQSVEERKRRGTREWVGIGLVTR